MTETILDEAARATSNDRNKVYGHPRLHFTCTAATVTAYLHRRGLLKEGAALLAEDWSQIIILDKVSRQAGNLTAHGKLHRDSLVDQAGYARTGEMLDEQPPKLEICGRCVRPWADCECHENRPPIIGLPADNSSQPEPGPRVCTDSACSQPPSCVCEHSLASHYDGHLSCLECRCWQYRAATTEPIPCLG